MHAPCQVLLFTPHPASQLMFQDRFTISLGLSFYGYRNLSKQYTACQCSRPLPRPLLGKQVDNFSQKDTGKCIHFFTSPEFIRIKTRLSLNDKTLKRNPYCFHCRSSFYSDFRCCMYSGGNLANEGHVSFLLAAESIVHAFCVK